MAKNLFLNIDDDVSRSIKRISAEKSADIILVVPKQALLFSDPTNIKLLKKQTELLNKNIAFLTMDPKGQQYALAAGFELRSFEHLKKAGPSMDMAKKRPSLSPQHSPVAHITKPVEPAAIRQQLQPRPMIVEEAYKIPEVYSEKREVPAVASIIKDDFINSPAALNAYQEKFETTLEDDDKKIKGVARKQNFRKANRVLFTGLIAALIIFLLLTIVILPQADITVYAATQPFSRDLPILVDQKAKDLDVQQLIVPGQLLNDTQTQSKQFTTTGALNTGIKATGQIQIYNFTKRTLKLGANTTTLVVGDRVYHFVNDASGIKQTEYMPNGTDIKTSSLSTPVEIVADQPGDDYNVPSGTRVEVHNDVLGYVPNSLYAVNTTNIDGGTSVLQTQISQQDLDSATKNLSDSVFQASAQQLNNTKGLTILSNGANIQIQNISFDSKVNDLKNTFNGTVNAHLSALAFDQKNIKKIVEQRIALTMDANKYFDTSNGEKITVDYKAGSVDLNGGTGILNVHVEGFIVSKIDTTGISGQITGKNSLEVKEMLLSNPNIDDVTVNFKPFWVRTVPRFSGRVYVHASRK